MPAEVDAIVRALGLAPHPEGGFFRETFRAPLTLEGLPQGPRAASTAIYYLLPAGATSAFHRVRSDELWHFYAGDPLELHLFDERGHAQHTLGPDLSSGERPQLVVPSGTVQGARAAGARYTLVGCTVAPGFDFADWQLVPREELGARFPSERALIEALTRR